jgi:putative nucleotidyltransferase with HDIG domain
VLRKLQKQTKAEVFLTGGFVRDFLRRRKNPDLDVVVRRLSYDEIIKFLDSEVPGSCKTVKLNDRFHTKIILFRDKGDVEAQIALPRKGKRNVADKNGKISQDAACRDFRINSLYLPINFSSKADVIDVVGGLKDIKNKLISCVDINDCLFKSPIRALRAISLAAVTKYKIEEKLLSEIGGYNNALKRAPADALRKEFNKIILSNKPSTYIKLMAKVGILGAVSPELEACIGVYQDRRYHKYDVFRHCVYTCDNTEPDLVLRLAGLFHDVGKPGTKKADGPAVTFHKHEMLGVKLARKFLNRLRYDNKTKSSVLNLIRLHMYHYTREYSDEAVRRFIKKLEITDDSQLEQLPLFKLRIADRLGNGRKTQPVTKRQLDFEERIREVLKGGASLSMNDLEIDGKIIMTTFDLEAGKLVGEIKRYLLDRVQADKTLNNRYSLIELALKFLKSKERYNNLKN